MKATDIAIYGGITIALGVGGYFAYKKWYPKSTTPRVTTPTIVNTLKKTAISSPASTTSRSGVAVNTIATMLKNVTESAPSIAYSVAPTTQVNSNNDSLEQLTGLYY